ncbi:MAG TPA: 2,3-bisphosphoglycerate-dependent phosphoglycerate mutase [Candidatus Paceibacterota bacterium]|nr:2,3-bisphosphoglycerate-dependent phosphoglycerate mutase [Candidatus Paceibacterota bacterium]
MARLFLIRHGKSEWNKLGKWTGWTDVSLDEDGIKEAERAGQLLCNEDVHKVYTSKLKRTHETFEHLKNGANKEFPESVPCEELNERNYGIHTGKNKWEVKEEVGEEAFNQLRRGWNVEVPEGETLKDVHARVVPFYESNIKKDLAEGKNVLVVAHGNTLRALVKHLEDLDEAAVCEVEIGTGEIHCYETDENGQIVSKEVRK